MLDQSLTSKTINGVGWNTIDKVANYGIGFIVGVILARLLSPEEYGLIGIITIFTVIFNIILDSGFSTALIRKDIVTNVDYSTVFYTNLFLSVILTFTLYFCALPIANFFNRIELIPLIHVMSFILIVNALSIVQQARLTKNIDFKTQTKISIISHTISGIIGISMAFYGYGVWALVAQQLSSRVFTTILLWIYNKWIPKLCFSWESFKILFDFSWKLLVASVISVVSNQLYQVVIGKCFSPATLGQYTRAQQYGNLCSSSIGDVVLKVSLPVMSSIQNDNERLIRAYRKIIKTTMLITFVFMFGLIAVAKPLIIVLIGKKWLPCVPFLQILSLQLMLYPLHMININMLTVQGRSDIQLVLQIVKTIISIFPILLGIYVGIYWMLIGSVIIGVISFFLNSFYSGKILNYTSWDQIKDILPSMIVAFIMAFFVWLVSLIPISSFIILPIQIIAGIVITIGLCELIGINEYKELKQIVTSLFLSFVHKVKR